MLNVVPQLFRRLATIPMAILLVLPASTNYQLRDYGFGSGGGDDGQSANYAALQMTGEPGNYQLVSSSYKSGNGLVFANQANGPAAPTLVSNDDYNRLKLTLIPGSDAADTQYAIAISADAFASTTNYVQSDDYVGAALGDEDWRTYAQRGGASGFFILGLEPNTTYTVKIRARQGDFTETGWGPTAAAATTDVSISFSIAGVASGTSVAGVTTDVTSTATSVPFGELVRNSRKEAAQTITVSTNANNGYTASVRQMGDLVEGRNIVFPTVSGTNTSPSAWPTSTVFTGAYGYHTSDGSLGTGTTTRFSANDTFAQFASTAQEIAYSASQVTNEATSIVYAIEVGKAQPGGDYSHTITYTVYGRF